MPLKKAKESVFNLKKWARKGTALKPSDRTINRLSSSDSSLESLVSEKITTMASGAGAKPKRKGEEEEDGSGLEDKFTSLLKSAVKDIVGQISDLGRDLGKQIKDLNAELSKNTDETKRMSNKIDQVTQLAKKNEHSINMHQEQIEQHQRKLVYMEDNSRRANIKLINFEVNKASEVKQEVMEWINSTMGTQFFSERDFERIHFVGGTKAKFLRPIIARFSTYAAKEQFMANIRSNSALLKRGSKTVQIYQDFSKETADWRRSMKEITAILLKNQMRYSWGFPMFLKIWRGTVLHRVHSTDEGMQLLSAWNLEADQSGSTGAASKS